MLVNSIIYFFFFFFIATGHFKAHKYNHEPRLLSLLRDSIQSGIANSHLEFRPFFCEESQAIVLIAIRISSLPYEKRPVGLFLNDLH